MKHTVSEQALALVEKKLPSLGGRLTPQDAAAATGVTVGEGMDALTRLMELYVTRVSYDEEGKILFAFELPLRRRGTKTAAEKWAAVREKLWRGFKVFYKIWIAVIMVGYFAVMLVLILLLIIASQAGRDRDDDRGHGMGENLIGGLFRALSQGLQFAFWTHAFSGGYAVDPYGYRYREARLPRGVRKKDQKSFFIAVYDFALGPERAEVDPMENEKEAAAFLRDEKGVITSAEVLALSGGDFPKAEERMADYLARFGGEPRITEEGVVVGEFEDFVARSDAKAEGNVVPFWEEYEAPFTVTGNTSGRNAIIAFMAAFTLVAGAILGPGGGLETLAEAYHSFFASGFARFLLSWMPMAFGLSFLLLPLLRGPFVKKKERERHWRNKKKKVMRVLFQGRLWRATAEQVHFTLLSLGDKDLKPEETKEILGRLVIDLQGDVELEPDGTPVYVFRRLEREFEAAERARGTQRRW